MDETTDKTEDPMEQLLKNYEKARAAQDHSRDYEVQNELTLFAMLQNLKNEIYKDDCQF